MTSRTVTTGIILGAVALLVLAAAVPKWAPPRVERRPTVSVELLAQPDAPKPPVQEVVTTASRLPRK